MFTDDLEWRTSQWPQALQYFMVYNVINVHVVFVCVSSIWSKNVNHGD